MVESLNITNMPTDESKPGQATELPVATVASETVTALAVTPPVTEVSAVTPSEMELAQNATVEWARSKVAEVTAEVAEMTETLEMMKKNHWNQSRMKRMLVRGQKRLDFYSKMLTALEHGYCIVPNFPVVAFAVRTDRTRPLKMYSTSWAHKHTQEGHLLPEGEGEYKNPFPLVAEQVVQEATPGKSEVKGYWATRWQDLEFPITMAKPALVEAVDRAMALKVFDELGILPGVAPSEMTRPPKGDPIIVGRIQRPFKVDGWPQRHDCVSFMICWHLNLKHLEV